MAEIKVTSCKDCPFKKVMLLTEIAYCDHPTIPEPYSSHRLNYYIIHNTAPISCPLIKEPCTITLELNKKD